MPSISRKNKTIKPSIFSFFKTLKIKKYTNRSEVTEIFKEKKLFYYVKVEGRNHIINIAGKIINKKEKNRRTKP